MRHIFRSVAILLACYLTLANGVAQTITDPDTIPINHVQVLGSHNSYRKPMEKRIFNVLRALNLFYRKKRSTPADQLFYSHLPFDEQFSQYGIRSLEIDIHHDPQGGLYYKRKGNWIGHLRSASGIPALKEPGLKVLHIADIDYNTHYLTFKGSLTAVRDWSAAHPQHLPIFILVEPKDDGIGNRVKGLGFTKVLPFDTVAFSTVDTEIREVFAGNPQMVFTPDMLLRGHASLRESILKEGWPTVKEMRGKVVFIINGPVRYAEIYSEGHPSFSGRMMFAFSAPERDDAAFVRRDDPHSADIPELVRQGYFVRTRTDTPGDEARLNDPSRREAAFASGAQLLCTDYYCADSRLSTYEVFLPDRKVAILNALSPNEVVEDWGE